MDDKQNSESIKDLINDIEYKRIVLPEFQRDFVWDIEKTFDLFDSLVKNIFIGSIIYGVPVFEISVRDIDRRPRKGDKSRQRLEIEFFSKERIKTITRTNSFRLILDGQQRVTSIYRALKGIDEVWFIAKNDDELDEKEKSEIKYDLEDYLFEFRGQEDKEKLSIRISDVYEMLEGKIRRENDKINKLRETEYFKKNEGILSEDEKNEITEKFLALSDKLQDMLKSEKLISYYLLDMSTEKFALFFERSNSKGIQLDFIDILAAKLYNGFNLREKIEQFSAINDQKYKLNREIIVRAISCIISDQKNVDRAFILNTLDSEDFKNYWSEVCELYKCTLDFLYNNHFIISQSWFPYENMIIPLMLFLKSLPNRDFSQMNQDQFEFIKYWYWSSVFSQKYARSTNEMILQDSKELIKIAKSEPITNRDFFIKMSWKRSTVNMKDDLYSLNKKGSGLYKGILNLINFYSKGILDWNNCTKLNFNSKLNDHHIFPKEYMKQTGKIDEENISLIDCVINRTLIPKITNIKIGSKSPSKYLKEIRAKNTSLESSLRTHLIPDETNFINGLYDDSFKTFLEERAKSIQKCLEEIIKEKENEVIAKHFKETKNKLSSSIKVFAYYNNIRFEAIFNIEDQNILYDNVIYSVSGAAIQVQKELTGKDNISTNGWKFWRFVNENGDAQYIEKLRT